MIDLFPIPNFKKIQERLMFENKSSKYADI